MAAIGAAWVSSLPARAGRGSRYSRIDLLYRVLSWHYFSHKGVNQNIFQEVYMNWLLFLMASLWVSSGFVWWYALKTADFEKEG